MSDREIVERLRKYLSARRFRHTLSVARLAKGLAAVHGDDPSRAWRAGVLHDCAKEWPGRRLAAAVRRRRLKVPGLAHILRHRRYTLLHAYVSADEARRSFGQNDRAVLSAIAKHTLADRRMGRLDKIVYVADFAAPERASAPAASVRRLAKKDLDAAFRQAVRLKLLHVLSAGDLLHPAAVDVWNGFFKWR